MFAMRMYQSNVRDWVIRTFGFDMYKDKQERAERVLEEAIEVVQAAGLSQERAEQILKWVYSKPPGELQREIGGLLIPLSALASAHGVELASTIDEEFQSATFNSLRIANKNQQKKWELDQMFPPKQSGTTSPASEQPSN